MDIWPEKKKALMIPMYGEENFRKMWTDWLNALIEIQEKGDGDLCSKLLHKVKCPTLIIHGEKDPMVPYEHPQYLHENINGSK